jgi:hypothetical protein
MRFGEKSTFAIECFKEDTSCPAHVLGRIRLWINGFRVGSFEEHGAMLAFQSYRLSNVLERLPTLFAAEFATLSDAQLFRLLGTFVDREACRRGAPPDHSSHPYQKFDLLTESGWPFAGVTSYVALEENDVRIICQHPPAGVVSTRVSKAEFTNTVESFLKWVAQ